ncbi:hypothetical protein PRZ48_015052 [Zasmidium cellare]|uniref:Uncharacterized protein n=1 Tax=Zasmidium cellare TaxID=395010 RepID=A0ABR0DXK3_ZASCE|nr:hypothetical protein PRZ48_015052 [Zasmidium cellare]
MRYGANTSDLMRDNERGESPSAQPLGHAVAADDDYQASPMTARFQGCETLCPERSASAPPQDSHKPSTSRAFDSRGEHAPRLKDPSCQHNWLSKARGVTEEKPETSSKSLEDQKRLGIEPATDSTRTQRTPSRIRVFATVNRSLSKSVFFLDDTMNVDMVYQQVRTKLRRKIFPDEIWYLSIWPRRTVPGPPEEVIDVEFEDDAAWEAVIEIARNNSTKEVCDVEMMVVTSDRDKIERLREAQGLLGSMGSEPRIG